MIKEINANILTTNCDIIVHSVNCRGVMGSGLAKQVKEKYPEVFEHYLKQCQLYSSTSNLGKTLLVETSDKKVIANCFTQNDFGGDKKLYTNYHAMYTSLKQVAEFAKTARLTVAIPYKMGCDRGGADWRIVYNMIEVLFEGVDLTICKYKENMEFERWSLQHDLEDWKRAFALNRAKYPNYPSDIIELMMEDGILPRR